MAPPLLQLRDIHLTFGGTPLLTGAELSVSPGERVCLVGRNGSGKSTLLKIAAGMVEADRGERFLQPDATVRYLPQEPDFSGYETTLQYVEAGLGPADEPYRAQYLLSELGLAGDEDPKVLSGGEARRAALARVLAPEPDILMLDEPTNHLDLPVIEWLEGELASRKSALVLISHDRRFLQNLSRVTVWLDRGKTNRLDAGFGAFEAWRDKLLEEEERDQQKLARKIAMEEHWLRYGVTARRKRNVRRLGDLHALRQQQRDYRGVQGNVTLEASEAQNSGKMVVEAKSISKRFGDVTVVDDFSVRILRGDCVGIIGPNGAGKTTLLRMLTGQIEPDSGSVRLGANLEIATLDQKRESLQPEATLQHVLTGGVGDKVIVGGRERHVVGYMKDFLFSPEQARTAVTALSGGERGRLMLAKALATPSNVLVLDEPTNDLDLETLDLLEEMVADYEGTVILVSHDRDFLDRVSTFVIAAEGKGRWQAYAGGYSDMVAQRGHGVGARHLREKEKADKPKKAEPKPQAEKKKGKLSFKDKHALETLPKRMEALQQDVDTLSKTLADPNLFSKQPDRFAEASRKLEKAQADLEHAEEEWLRLEMLREEMEG
ncbi:ABC-F family ATP-binding cassette domain-containing protein [Lutibaculum baratangense]|uniref:ATP-binding protein Uup n=1 Tax=Lutibaculum baratangense AMV1 TaxID=631454 RepID=V4RCG2_9HYPH|nr:ATP-binding cassette domain-containing protein [Lutibaculum baratangense]ESR23856.1 ABC transporter, ATP-binding protein [Lutibaculum baratangense AMV1]